MYNNLSKFDDADFENKRVFIRVDYNVPIQNGKVMETFKITSTLPTILQVYNKNPKNIIIGTHLGKPKGKYNAELSCMPIFSELKRCMSIILGEEVLFCKMEDYKPEKIVFLENLRFYPEEQPENSESANSGMPNDSIMKSFFDKHVDIVIIDAFGVLHRDAYSVIRTGKKTYAGRLVENEVKVGNEVLKEGVDMVILGGSKISDKIHILKALIPRCKTVYVLGAIAYTFLKYHFRIEVGKSKIEEGTIDVINEIYDLARVYDVEIYVSHDYKIEYNERIYYTSDIPKEGKGKDIGPKTIDQLRTIVSKHRNIFWNGPPGVFEEDSFQEGTISLLRILEEHGDRGKVIVGGGETASCVMKFSQKDKFYHVSTGGGAFLKLLSKDKMPGLEFLKK